MRGEFIVPKTIFDAKYKDTFSNPRNFVAGLINAKTVNASIKDLDFVVYEMIKPDMKPSEQMAELVKHKFDVVQHDLIPSGLSKDLLMQTLMAWRANNKYEIDGIITQAGVNFSPENAVEISADFVTTGPIRLLAKTTPSDRLLLQDDGEILLEQNAAAALLQEDIV